MAGTVKVVEAWPPVGRDALITYVPGLLGTTKLVVQAPPGDAVTVFVPVGEETVMLDPGGKYDPYVVTVCPGAYVVELVVT
ncbi:MAG: hypothetical protein LC808_14955 [Actinobacteria bacterium]|nr:hypothetical protein [Actinomycetota bacterium]